MPGFSTEIANPLSKDEAVERLRGFMASVAEKYKDQVSDMQATWDGDVMTFAFTSYGFNISGVMTVDEDKVKIDGKLPFAAAMFRGKIENDIAEELRRQLA